MAEPTPITKLHDAEDSEWFTIAGEVTRLVPDDELHEKKVQEGRIRDGTASIKFTNWGGTDALTEGDVVLLNGVVTDEYHGNISISLNSATDVESVDKETVPGSLGERPRRDILDGFTDVGPNKLDAPDVDRYAVTASDIGVDEASEPLDHVRCDNLGKRFASPLWEELGESAESLTFAGNLGDTDFHNLSLYGVEDGSVVLGMVAKPSNKRSDPEWVESFRNFLAAADEHPNAEIETEGSVKWMAVGECRNCGALVNMDDHLGVHVYSPDEDYLSFYDWWRETSRHNLSIPECPECGEKELEPPETAKTLRFTYRAPLADESAESVAGTIDALVAEDVTLHFTKNEILRRTGEQVLSQVGDAVEATGSVSVKAPGVGRRYSDVWPKRYIVLSFDDRLTESELNTVADAVRDVGEGITEVKDTNDGTIVKLAEHKP